ncbi:MAG: 3'-5' exonuclease [Helicobacteraceae bacterium]|nr:3'-5' exonuclease [Helicobacteraceae bacterium]
MPKRYDKILQKLQKRPLSQNEFNTLLSEAGGLFSDIESELEIIKLSGIPLEFSYNKVYFRPSLTPLEKETFCIVDIETNGHNPHQHSPIEIGAIKIQNGKIIDTFESFIFCEHLPEYITNITGITAQMLENAPKIHKVLESFKLFLNDSIFVAHNVDFDYNFLSASLEKNGFGFLYNPKICTIKLAKKTIPAPRYSLGFLNEFLNINNTNLHRALQDSKTALEIFNLSLKNINSNLHTSKDLLEFLNKNQKKGKKCKKLKTP